MAERYIENGSLDPDDIKKLADFARKVRAQHRQLHSEFRQSNYQDRSLSKRLENIHLFLEAFERPHRQYLEANARAAVAAVAGASFGPTPVVAAYMTAAAVSQEGMAELVEHLRGLERGQSPLLTEGNKVEPVHQEKLWQAKTRLLDRAVEEARQGRPQEIGVQYFELTSSEIVAKLAEAARLGCPVRINVDPSRLQPGGLVATSVDDGPRKLRALLQLANLPGCDVAVSIYPVARELGSFSELMHRKLVRVGDTVLLGGMNANEGSGENVDAGYLIRGPAARALGKILATDLAASAGARAEDIYGQTQIDKFADNTMSLTPRGLAALFDALSGPSPAGTPAPRPASLEELQELARKAGTRLEEVLDVDPRDLPAQVEAAMVSSQLLPLSDKGKSLLERLVARAIQKTTEGENVRRLTDVSLPSGEVQGATRVAVGSEPAEREALMLHAISRAEEYIYVPTFVVTRAVARALAARREQLRAQGKELDIRVVADPGIYPYGGTPNEDGVIELEDAGIPVRWALLPRSDGHDRKIHAKEVLTEKSEFFGSTNLSRKGMRDNWELSGLVYFDDPEAAAAREENKARFLKLWEYESFELNTRQVAEKRLEGVDTADRETRINEARKVVIRSLINGIARWEADTATFVEKKLEDPQIAARAAELRRAGMAEGYARLLAVEESMGTEAFYQALHSLPSYRSLQALQDPGPGPLPGYGES
jgi:phosphatidylserine/phosphatidylglycerophosphate/cardiolipin synthase-like enzyme